jgi:hypothetical protein
MMMKNRFYLKMICCGVTLSLMLLMAVPVWLSPTADVSGTDSPAAVLASGSGGSGFFLFPFLSNDWFYRYAAEKGWFDEEDVESLRQNIREHPGILAIAASFFVSPDMDAAVTNDNFKFLINCSPERNNPTPAEVSRR